METMTVTCRTDGCGNSGTPIDLLFDPGSPPGVVICGVCSQEITEVRK